MLYLWIKALHIVAMVCWFAALFYLPRLFVYHAMSDDTVSVSAPWSASYIAASWFPP
jgi:uncharacterized membrane protein